jgi:hypothetical protein
VQPGQAVLPLGGGLSLVDPLEAAEQAPQADPVAVAQRLPRGGHAVHAGAVLASHVLQDPTRTSPAQPRVAPRDPGIFYHEAAVGIAPHD